MWSRGLRPRLDEARTRELLLAGRALEGQGGGIPGFPCYRTVEETFQSAQAIVAAHPGLATWIDVGDSWEKTVDAAGGYDLFVLKLTQSAVPGPKPVFFASFAIHAREYATAELGTRFAEFLIDGYGTDPDITWLLDSHEIHLMLQTNPDGRKEAEAGVAWRKNTNNDYCSNNPSRGADLNRNFDFEWGCCGGSSGQQCSDVFRGPAAASEPEIQALQAYVRSIFPDQRGPNPNDPAPDDATGVAIDVHSFGELVLWPWGFTNASPANGTAFRTLGRKVAFWNDSFPLEISDFTIADGSSADFYYGDLGVAGLGFEIGTSFFQSCGSFEAS
ncbi:MAG: M14 family zinc carboxypeptidase, partial [Acidobacteriota bacterium]